MNYKKVIFLSSAGHMLEFFDFTLYNSLSLLIAPLFFPSDNYLISLMASFGAFAAGYIMRPLGGLIFGYIGDHYGRKVAFLSSMIIIIIPTFGILFIFKYLI